MFHSHNRGPLTTLINNLRQSGFYWTSFTPEEIRRTIDTSRKWLEKEEHHNPKYKADRLLLERAIKSAEVAIHSSSWAALSASHEMGVFVSDFPEAAREAWSLVIGPRTDPILVGAPQLADAQRHVDSKILENSPDPVDGLTGWGIRTMKRLEIAATAMANANDPHKTPPHKVKNILAKCTKRQARYSLRGDPTRGICFWCHQPEDEATQQADPFPREAGRTCKEA